MFSGYYLGDTNEDDAIDILDVITSVNYIIAGEYNNLADINQNQSIDILDVVLLLNIILRQ